MNGGGISKDQIENIEILFIPSEYNILSDSPIKLLKEYEESGYHAEFKFIIDSVEYNLGDTLNIYNEAALAITNEKYELPELSYELLWGKIVGIRWYVRRPNGGTSVSSVSAKISQLYVTDGGEIGAMSYNASASTNEYNYYINNVEDYNGNPNFYFFGDFFNSVASIDNANKYDIRELKNGEQCLCVYWYKMPNNNRYTMKVLTFSYSFSYGKYIWLSDPA